jgi:hypothetical protein
MFEMMLSDPQEEPAATPTTVADKRRLVQDVVPDVNQPRILCPLQRIQQFINRSPSPESLFSHKIGGSTQTHADVINGRRTIFTQMPCFMPAIALAQTPSSSFLDIFRCFKKT